MSVDDYLRVGAELRASDLFLRGNARPCFRVHGQIRTTDYPVLTPEEVRTLAYTKMSGRQIEEFERHHEMDLAFTVDGVTRIRNNVFMQRGTVGCVYRLIPI